MRVGRVLILAASTRAGVKMGPWPSPSECNVGSLPTAPTTPLSSEHMLHATSGNATLLSYLFPQNEPASVRDGWRAVTPGCRIVPSGCWCFHVEGRNMVRAESSAKRCAVKDVVQDCTLQQDPVVNVLRRKNCSCFAQDKVKESCLFGDMRPAKLLSIIAACRAAGVTHIIEQGRFGGLSSYMYALHGFRVTSIELLPLSEVSDALRSLDPHIALVDGDGRAEVMRAVASASNAGERSAVIFDGEKRRTAYSTFLRVKARVALAVFDDSNLDGGEFPRFLKQQKEVAWHTWDCAGQDELHDEQPRRAPARAVAERAQLAAHHARVGERVGCEQQREDRIARHEVQPLHPRRPRRWAGAAHHEERLIVVDQQPDGKRLRRNPRRRASRASEGEEQAEGADRRPVVPQHVACRPLPQHHMAALGHRAICYVRGEQHLCIVVQSLDSGAVGGTAPQQRVGVSGAAV